MIKILPQIVVSLRWCIVFLALWGGTTPAWAVSLVVSNSPSQVVLDHDVTVGISLSGTNMVSKTYYLRGVFYKEGTTKYFGYTFNHLGNWHNDTSNPQLFKAIITDSGSSYSGQMTVKADLNNANYQGPGTYFFKIARYTATGTSPTDWSNSVAIEIIDMPPPTPTSTPPPTPPPTPAPSPTPEPTEEPTPTPTSTPLPSDTPSPSPTPTTSPDPTMTPSPSPSTTPSPTPSPTPTPAPEADLKKRIRLSCVKKGVEMIFGRRKVRIYFPSCSLIR